MPREGQKTVTLPKKLWEELRELAEEENRSIPRQVRRVLDAYKNSGFFTPADKNKLVFTLTDTGEKIMEITKEENTEGEEDE